MPRAGQTDWCVLDKGSGVAAYGGPVLVWLNGTFGVGKTTTAQHLCRPERGLRMFDAEEVGYMVRGLLRDVPHEDFQDLPPWRSLVPRVAADISAYTGSDLLAVQTVLRHEYWTELQRGLADEGMTTLCVLLHCSSDELRRRASDDQHEPGALAWRLAHIERYEEATAWMTQSADLVVDTTSLPATDVAQRIWNAVCEHCTSTTGSLAHPRT